MLDSSLTMQRNSEQDNGHFSVLDRRKSGVLSVTIVHKENGTKSLSWWCLNSQKADTQSSEARVHCPRGQLKSKGGGNLSIHYCADLETITTVFRTIFPVNQLSLYGAVAEMCEEYESFHDRTGNPVVGGQSSSSFVPSVIKTDVPLDSEDRAHNDLLLQKYGERIEKLSQLDRLSKFCMDEGFLNVVEIGQYFMTKDTEEFSQFTDSVACREYTLPRDEETSEPIGWIRGNTKIGPVLEVTTCCQQGKYGVEIRIRSISKDNSHSWVRIYHGLKKIGYEFDQQRAGNLRDAVRRLCVDCTCFCEPIKG